MGLSWLYGFYLGSCSSELDDGNVGSVWRGCHCLRLLLTLNGLTVYFCMELLLLSQPFVDLNCKLYKGLKTQRKVDTGKPALNLLREPEVNGVSKCLIPCVKQDFLS